MMHACAVGRTHVLDVLAMLALLLGALLTSAQAAAPPEIRHFEADPVDVLGPGTELSFRLEGTPKAQATVSISGIKQPIPLRETAAGALAVAAGATVKVPEDPLSSRDCREAGDPGMWGESPSGRSGRRSAARRREPVS